MQRGLGAPLIAQLEERETVDVADISMSPVRTRVGGFLSPTPTCLVDIGRETAPLKHAI